MNILHINNTDLPGRRFNGYDLHLSLNGSGCDAKQLVATKVSQQPTVVPLNFPRDYHVRASISRLENSLGMDTIVNPFGNALQSHPAFQSSDIVHYHLIHNNLISILDLPRLARLKPSVWTIHDPWAFTGGCVHPLSCDGWRRECGECADNPTLRIRAQCTRDMLCIKRAVFADICADIVVASDFSARFFSESGMFGDNARLHHIPFGIDTGLYTKKSSAEARAILNIPEDNFVIAFRSEVSPLKGCQFIFEALASMSLQNTTILTVGSCAVADNISSRVHTVGLGWQNDMDMLLNFYAACDIFLMPSLAESFGLMAIEAMAAGKPVICFDNTALYGTTFAPGCGLSVPYQDSAALKSAIELLRDNIDECLHRGSLGKTLAAKHYNYDDYFKKHLDLYREICNRRAVMQ